MNIYQSKQIAQRTKDRIKTFPYKTLIFQSDHILKRVLQKPISIRYITDYLFNINFMSSDTDNIVKNNNKGTNEIDDNPFTDTSV